MKNFYQSTCGLEKSAYICTHNDGDNTVKVKVSKQAKVAQLVEHDLAKVGVASSNLVFRSQGPL